MLSKLMLGVRQFQNESFKPMQEIFEHLSQGQNPKTLIITCSDSRLMPEKLTGAEPGEIFFIRNVGNIIPPFPIPSSEAAGIVFALNEFESIQHIIICGHSHCGAMKGLLTPNLKDHLPEVSSWLSHSHPVLKKMNDSKTVDSMNFASKVEQATKLNIITQLEHLKSYPIVSEKLARETITLHGWLYEFEKGDVLVYEPQSKEFISFERALECMIAPMRSKIIEQVAMEYIEPLTHPQTIKEYKLLEQLLSSLEKNILPIWPSIKAKVAQKLKVELGALDSSFDNPQFDALLTPGNQLKLNNLKDFQKNITESSGYQQYMGQIMRYSLFSPSLRPLTSSNSNLSFPIRY